MTFSDKSKTIRLIELVKQLLDKGENTIIYCSQKAFAENKAKIEAKLTELNDRKAKIINLRTEMEKLSLLE